MDLHRLVELGSAISLAGGAGLLWAGCIRFAGQPGDPVRVRLGQMFALAGIFVVSISAGILLQRAGRAEATVTLGSSWARTFLQFGVTTVSTGLWIAQCVILTKAYRRHQHRLTPGAANLLKAILILTWGYVPLNWLIRSTGTRYLHGLDMVSLITVQNLIQNLGITLPTLVLAWLLVTGRLVNDKLPDQVPGPQSGNVRP